MCGVPEVSHHRVAILAITAPSGALYRGNMSTVLVAPGVELPVSGRPFGETPAQDVDNLRRRVARKARTAVIVLVILVAAACGILWRVGRM